MTSDSAGVKRVIEDLGNEHTRWQARIDRLMTIKHNDPEAEKAAAQLAFCESQRDYVDLLLRRYRSWLA